MNVSRSVDVRLLAKLAKLNAYYISKNDQHKKKKKRRSMKVQGKINQAAV